jgi:hypothetical protein
VPSTNYDIKTAYTSLYSPSAKDFVVVDVPEFAYLMVDGHGDPNTAPSYVEAVQSLYSTSYSCRAIAKKTLDRVHTVGPLEGLWWSDDLTAFTARRKGDWSWTMMIAQPEWITPEIVAEAKLAKGTPGVRFEKLTEGRCVQIMHVGSYDDETPVLARLHDEYLPAAGLTERGHHHEIYISDPRKTAPEKLRTVLRQPVA